MKILQGMQKICEKSQTSFSSCCSFALDCTTNMLQECDAFVDSLYSFFHTYQAKNMCEFVSGHHA